jgi:hypothetical protein
MVTKRNFLLSCTAFQNIGNKCSMYLLGKEDYKDLSSDSDGINEVYVNANMENCKLKINVFE